MDFLLHFRFLFIYLFRFFYSSFVLAVRDSSIQYTEIGAKELHTANCILHTVP
jgi:hypothetical protein